MIIATSAGQPTGIHASGGAWFREDPGIKPWMLGFGALEDGVADFDAVSNREDARLLAFAAIDGQHDAIRKERLLHHAVIQKLPRVLDRNTAWRAFVIFEPEDTE